MQIRVAHLSPTSHRRLMLFVTECPVTAYIGILFTPLISKRRVRNQKTAITPIMLSANMASYYHSMQDMSCH